eukprot:m.224485 g.224485  ORF g.224485 m.224485 type:complete len:87 (-) comp17290_c0_seq5:1682-1942(-)
MWEVATLLEPDLLTIYHRARKQRGGPRTHQLLSAYEQGFLLSLHLTPMDNPTSDEFQQLQATCVALEAKERPAIRQALSTLCGILS